MRVKYLLIIYLISIFIQLIFTFEYQNGSNEKDDDDGGDDDEDENKIAVDSCKYSMTFFSLSTRVSDTIKYNVFNTQ